MISPAPIGAATSSAAAQPSSISALYAVPGAPLAMELQNTIRAGGTARNIGQKNKRNPVMKAALVKRVDTTARIGNSIIGISEYLDEETGMSLIPRPILPDPPHRQPRRQNRPAARLPAASGTPAWPIKPPAKPSKAHSRFSGTARASVAASNRGGISLRASAAQRRGSSQVVMARGGPALGDESRSARISASWSPGGQDMAQLG